MNNDPDSHATKRVTVKHVAQEAGVAIGTVSRVIRNESNVAPEMRERVVAAIKKLGWQPSMAAQSMRGVRSKTIGFIFSDIRNPLYSEMVKGAEELLARYGYMLIVGSSDGKPEVEQALIDRFTRWNIEGLLFTVSDETNRTISETLGQLQIPKVIVERGHPLADATVGADHYRGTLQATEFLLQQGHKRIGLISGGKDTRVGQDRLRAYRLAHEKAGVSVDEELLRLESFSQDYGYQETQLLLELANRPTAIMALGMRLLGGVLRAVQNKNFRIPEEVSLIASNDSELAQLATPPITAIRYDAHALGHDAAQLLMRNLLRGEALNKTRIDIATELVLRASCAPPH